MVGEGREFTRFPLAGDSASWDKLFEGCKPGRGRVLFGKPFSLVRSSLCCIAAEAAAFPFLCNQYNYFFFSPKGKTWMFRGEMLFD